MHYSCTHTWSVRKPNFLKKQLQMSTENILHYKSIFLRITLSNGNMQFGILTGVISSVLFTGPTLGFRTTAHRVLHMEFVTKKKTRILMTHIFKNTVRIWDQSPKPIGFMPCFSIPLIRVVLSKNLTSLSTNALYSAWKNVTNKRNSENYSFSFTYFFVNMFLSLQFIVKVKFLYFVIKKTK